MHALNGKKVAFLAADGVELVELTEPWHALQQAGAGVQLVSLFTGEIQGMHHDRKADMFRVDKVIEDADASDYDGLVLPGGVMNPDLLRVNPMAVNFVKEFFLQGKPIAAICHGPWMLVEADVVRGKKVTSWPSLKTDLMNAGAEWVDAECMIDNGLITSRKPDDLPAFCASIVSELASTRSEAHRPELLIAART
jgi:protease I